MCGFCSQQDTNQHEWVCQRKTDIVWKIVIMPKGKHGESDKGKDKPESQFSKLNVSLADVETAKSNFEELYTKTINKASEKRTNKQTNKRIGMFIWSLIWSSSYEEGKKEIQIF